MDARITQELEALLAQTDLDSTDRHQRFLVIAEEHGLDSENVQKQFHAVFEKKLRAKVKTCLQPDLSPLQRVLKKQAVKTWLRNFLTDHKDINTIMDTYAKEEEDIILSTIKDALSIQKDRNRYLVEELLLRGAMYLVAAAPKTGKSLLATNLGVSVVTGQKFLNRHCQSGLNVLFIQNEENIAETARRAYTNGLQKIELENPGLFNDITTSERFVIAKNLDIVQDLKRIFEIVDAKKIDLLIIDSLSASITKGGLNEHSPELLSGLLALQQNIQDRNITGVLIHHTIKSDSNENRQEMVKGIAGRSDIVRANDGIIKMAPKGTTSVEVFFLPRNGVQAQFVIEKQDGEACFWSFEVTKEESLSPENLTIQNKILRVLKAKYDEWVAEGKGLPVGGYVLSELEKEVNYDRDTIIARLNYMIGVEGIEVTPYRRKHLYHFPKSGESWLEQYLLEEEEKVTQQKALFELYRERKDKLLSMTTSDAIIDLTQDWTEEDKKQVQSLMSSTELNQLRLINNPPKYPVGDYVSISIDGQVSEPLRITKIVWVSKSKLHQYTLENTEGVFLESNLTK